MAAKSKTPSKLDKIDDIETQVSKSASVDASEPEEKVISVRIPRKNTESKEDKDADKSVETPEKPVKPEPKTEDTTSETESAKTESVTEPQKTVSKEPSVSSFSLLDADKESSSSEKKPETAEKPAPETSEEKPTKVVESEESASDSKETSSSDNLSSWLNDSDTEKLTDTPTTMEEPKGSKLKAFLIALLVVIILGAIGGGIYYYTTKVDNEEPTPVDVTTNNLPTPTSTPTPTEAPEPVELSDYSVEVLNGSGVAGQAGVISTLLEEEGFASADAANADNQEYEETIVTMKEDTPEGVFTELESILGDQYVLELSDDTLDTDSEYDVQVILGSSEPEDDIVEEDTTSTPTEEAGI